MEQQIIDASKYKITIHSLDSRFSNMKDSSYSQFRVVTPYPIKNVVRVRLASVELPLVEYIFSPSKGNTTISVRLGFALKYVTTQHIPSGNYTASALLSVVSTLLQALHSGFNCTLDPISGIVSITNSTIVFAINFVSTNPSVARRTTHWGMGYYLGFRDRVITATPDPHRSGGFIVNGTSVCYVQPNPYYILQLNCPDKAVNVMHRLDNDTYIEAFAKLILQDNYYQIQFDDSSNLMRKEQMFLSPVNIPFFEMRLLDPWGELVDMMESDWSLTLEITEIVNSKTYTEISKTYRRN